MGVKFKISMIAYKVTRKMAPVYLNEKITMFEATNIANLRPGHGRDRLMFDCSLKQSKIETWLTKMILEWNGLPMSLRKIDNFDEFKSKLKTFYFKQAFPGHC